MSDGRGTNASGGVVEQLKPEAAYCTLQNGRRACLMVFAMQDAAQMPPTLEPLFHANSTLSLQPVMNLDGPRAGLTGTGR
ncbi:hypothetical protein ACFWBV_07660 [Streptomyces sp. NPDC060030]|uniref:hypothetical protein n=1 Tax=Streptomyces sp. NPDC060030 TaxID=3347042 RepID=UPI0036AAAF07